MFVITIKTMNDADVGAIMLALEDAAEEGEIEDAFDVKVDETTETK